MKINELDYADVGLILIALDCLNREIEPYPNCGRDKLTKKIMKKHISKLSSQLTNMLNYEEDTTFVDFLKKIRINF